MSKVLKNFIGIDISKPFYDAAILRADQPNQTIHQQFSQTLEGYKEMMVWLEQHNICLNEESLICMEYTGIYNSGLVNFLIKRKAQLWVEMPLRIKKSAGFERGSDDKTSAIKIAGYAFRFQDRMQLWRPVDSSIEKLKNLIAQRDRVVNCINQLIVPLKELSECGCTQDVKDLEKLQRSSTTSLEKTKEAIEKLIVKTVQQDEEINKKTELVKSIKGIGQVTAVALLVYTKGFTAFENAKELACYCGVVPFNKTSGISVRFKPSVSPHANKKLKRLLHLCALAAIKNDVEIKTYFERKVAEGKSKMCVINAVRNKLIHRVFAVVRDNRFYEDNYMRKCA
jgi:transposase